MTLVPTRPQGNPPTMYQSVSYTPLPPTAPITHHTPRHLMNRKPLPIDEKSINSVTKISASWRGFSTRRHLRRTRIYQEYLYKATLKMQCFVRCVNAKQELARRKAWKHEWLIENRKHYDDHQLSELMPQLQWRKAAMDNAARVLQQAWLWYRTCNKLREEDPNAELPPYPTAGATQPAGANDWERTSDSNGGDNEKEKDEEPHVRVFSPLASPGSPSGSPSKRRGGGKDESPRMFPGQVIPYQSPVVFYEGSHVSEQDVLDYNAAMRRHEMYKEHCQLEPYSQSRHAANRYALKTYDLDGCASIIQRRWRGHIAECTVSTRKVTTEYFNRYACIIQRAVRCTSARSRLAQRRIRRQKLLDDKTELFNSLQLKQLKDEVVWNRHTLDAAATIIQRAWRYYRKVEGSTEPPYGLLEGTRSPPHRRHRAQQEKNKEKETDAPKEEPKAEEGSTAKAEEAQQEEEAAPSPAVEEAQEPSESSKATETTKQGDETAEDTAGANTAEGAEGDQQIDPSDNAGSPANE